MQEGHTTHYISTPKLPSDFPYRKSWHDSSKVKVCVNGADGVRCFDTEPDPHVPSLFCMSAFGNNDNLMSAFQHCAEAIEDLKILETFILEPAVNENSADDGCINGTLMRRIGTGMGSPEGCFLEDLCAPPNIFDFHYAAVAICAIGLLTNLLEVVIFLSPELRGGNNHLYAISGFWDIAKLITQIIRHTTVVNRLGQARAACEYDEKCSTEFSHSLTRSAFMQPIAAVCPRNLDPIAVDLCFERGFDLLSSYTMILISLRMCRSFKGLRRPVTTSNRWLTATWASVAVMLCSGISLYPVLLERVGDKRREEVEMLCVPDMVSFFVLCYALPTLGMCSMNLMTLRQITLARRGQRHLRKHSHSRDNAAIIICAITAGFIFCEAIPQTFIFAHTFMFSRTTGSRIAWPGSLCYIDTYDIEVGEEKHFAVWSASLSLLRGLTEACSLLSLFNCICIDQAVYFVFSRQYRRRLLSLFCMDGVVKSPRTGYRLTSRMLTSLKTAETLDDQTANAAISASSKSGHVSDKNAVEEDIVTRL